MSYRVRAADSQHVSALSKVGLGPEAGIVALALVIGGCGSSEPSPPGGVSAGEAKALEEAAEMLDRQRLPDDAIPPLDAPPENASDTQDPPQMTGDTPE
ncbi:MAG: hypothetical protein AAF494_01550 [Pseudomonadota bacterium]